MWTLHVSSNLASGPERKSTSGGMMMINGTVVKHWSRTQADACAEHGGSRVLRSRYGCSTELGMQSMLADLGVSTQVRVWTDSNAVKAIASRRGLLGKTRHVELRYLWLQEMNRSRRVKNETNSRRTESGRPLAEGKSMASD